MVFSGLLLWPLDDGQEFVRFYREWACEAPDELTTALIMKRAPVVGFIPPELHGRPVIGVACCWSGAWIAVRPSPSRCGGSNRQQWTSLRPASSSSSRPSLIRATRMASGSTSKATNIAALTDDVADRLLAHAGQIQSGRSGIIAWQLGGAVAHMAEAATPFGSRGSGFLVDILGATDGPSGFEGERAWAREGWASIASQGTGVYVNWLMDEGQDRVQEAYGAERYARLRRIKARYDPENVFRFNQNVPPA